jgi:trehalose 6-phosphate phosphatase
VRWILSRSGRTALARFLAQRPLIALDFDGTLAPIVRRPESARLRAATRRALRAVCARHAVVVVSGRTHADVAARVEGLGVRSIVGNHGAELAPGHAAVRRRVAAWARLIAPLLAHVDGVEVENKGLSLSVHTRRARDRRAARDAVGAALAALVARTSVRVLGGHEVTNVLQVGAPTKLDAVRALMRRHRRRCALFLGDDLTDEDVFGRADAMLWGVRVGRSRASAAPWYVRDQAEVDELLECLARLGNTQRHDARSEPDARRPRAR